MRLAVNYSKAWVALCLACGATFGSACAAEPDPSGTWKFTLVFQTGGSGEFDLDVMLKLKADGGKVTGKISAPDGEGMVDVLDGKFEKGVVSFRVVDTQGITSRYKGKIDGDKIKGEMEAKIPGELEPLKLDWNAKREKEKK